MKKVLGKNILVAIVAICIATSFSFKTYADIVPILPSHEVVPSLGTLPGVVTSDWVYIKERDKYMHVTVYNNGTVAATKDKCFESIFNGVKGYYATDQEGYMIKGYVLFNDNLYYFQSSGEEVGKLLAGRTINYKGNNYDIDEFGRVKGDLSNIFATTAVYNMGNYKGE